MFGAGNATPRGVAIDLLARREYSRAELHEKLAQKTFEEADILECLDALEEQGLQNDDRFSESFVRSRVLRGQGPIRIKMELGRRGIRGDAQTQAINAVAEQERIDWFELAAETLQRRFRTSGAPSGERFVPPKERAKRERFLAQRGFDFEQIRYALSTLSD
ncbi:regulatory protein RecX [Halomonas sp. GD1P12]|uniref:regulatory protein RecX n=1 Tax=Halomonas sp. GD1P12 TaxID=2982691 RepID=UPI0021E43C9F|nr:regulatory protein RecX [Halomonas sp. GD1P12]UYF99153.1 recombination regulator RecX [Halomonas sp. GD1P12]